MFDSFLVALNAIMPTFLLLAFGYFLKHKNFVSSEFLKQTNTLTFKFFLPFLLFNNIYKTEITEAIDGMTFTIAVGSLLFLFAVLCIVVPRVVREPKHIQTGIAMLIWLVGSRRLLRMAGIGILASPRHGVGGACRCGQCRQRGHRQHRCQARPQPFPVSSPGRSTPSVIT